LGIKIILKDIKNIRENSDHYYSHLPAFNHALSRWRREMSVPECNFSQRSAAPAGPERLLTLLLVCMAALLFLNPVTAGAAEKILSMGDEKKPLSEWEIEGLKRALSDPDEKVREKAVSELAETGNPDNIPGLGALLTDKNPAMRKAALGAVTKMGASSAKFAPEVIEDLDGQDKSLKYPAVTALAGIGKLQRGQIPAVIKLLGDKDGLVRAKAVQILSWNREYSDLIVPAALDMMRTGTPEEKVTGMSVLGRMGPEGVKHSADIAKMLNSGDASVRAGAAAALGDLGSSSKPYAGDIAKLLKDKNSNTVLQALKALGRIGDLTDEQTMQVAGFLESKNSNLSGSAAKALGSIGKAKSGTAGLIVRYLRSTNPKTRATTMMAIGEMGKNAREYVPNIAELLKDDSPMVRITAIRTLGDMGNAGKTEAGQIKKLLSDKSAAVSREALSTLSQMGVPLGDSAGVIVKMLQSPDRKSQVAAATVLARMGDEIGGQVPDLIDLLKTRNPKNRSTVLYIFSKMGAPSKEYAPQVAELLDDPNPAIRIIGLKALGGMGKFADGETGKMLESLKDKDPEVRAEAASALGKTGSGSKELLDTLSGLLKDESAKIRLSAVGAIARLSGHPKIRAERIAPMLEDEKPEVRNLAAVALGEIGPDAAFEAPRLASYIESLDDANRTEITPLTIALESLGGMGQSASGEAGTVARALYANKDYVRMTARKTLREIGPFSPDLISLILGATYTEPKAATDTRLLVYFAEPPSGPELTAIKWIGIGGEKIPADMDRTDAGEVLGFYLSSWDLTSGNQKAREAFVEQIAAVVEAGKWTREDLPLLKKAQEALASGQFENQASAVNEKIGKVQG